MIKVKYPIVKPVMPNKQQYVKYIEQVIERNWLTNNGPLLQELECRLAEYLGVEHLMLVSNGTLALHLAYKVLEINNAIATTPFSFAATASSITWEGHTPYFVDISEHTFNINTDLLATKTSASSIVAVHVFGNPCDVELIEDIAKKNKQTVIYDGAHAFGCQYKGKSLLSYGDAATLSLHATKMIHCVEGGAVIFKDKDKLAAAKQMINFGFDDNNMPANVGINAKMSEMHAAMGLTMLDNVDQIVSHRQQLVEHYQQQLNGVVCFQQWQAHSENNGAYMPILLRCEQQLLTLMAHLTAHGIQSRRYFYPSLSQVDCYGKQGFTPVANDISSKILCLPLYFDLSLADVKNICKQVKIALH
jgi:dTDP-4-amino-4,6-dideoxygalactose transaminase